MNLRFATLLLVCLLLGGALLSPSGNAARPRANDAEFVMRFTGVDDPNVARIVYGKPFTAAEPRGPLGMEETEAAFQRKTSLAAETNVEFVTKPFRMPTAPLRLNVDALHGAAALTRGAYVMVEALDEQGKVIPGFEREKSLAADVNELDYPVTWFGGNTATLNSLAGKTVSLHFFLRDARLYAIHTREYAKPPLGELRLTVDRTSLEPWETSRFHLQGRAKGGQLLALDHQPVSYVLSDADLVIAKSEKRNLHEGNLTVYRETNAARRVTFQAEVVIGNRKAQSNAVTLDIRPLSKTFGSSDFKLLFLQPSDLVDAQGAVTLAANRLEYYADTRGLLTTPKAMTLFNRKIGDKYYVWGCSRGNYGQVFRGVTADGINFTTEPVAHTMAPNNFLDLTYSPARDEYLAFERVGGPHRWQVHQSKDGLHFTKLGVAYQDFDGIKLVWDEANNQYVAFQLSYQPLAEPRRYADNLQTLATKLGNRGRRIFTRRTSPDGLNWTPNNNTNQAEPTTWTDPRYYAIVPDAGDPPDLECYWLDVFPYGDRYLGMVMWYAAAPPAFLDRFPYDPYPSKHGPHVRTEWIVSSDLKTWERPFREVKAAEDVRLYFMHAPLVLHDRMLFLVSNQNYDYPLEGGAKPGQNNEIYSLPIDRVISANGAGRASFTTKPFVMPKVALHLNAEGALAVEALDADGRVVRGFEKAKNVLSNLDELHHKLKWNGAETAALAGQTVRLRFHLQNARVYSLHTYK